jgi:hypothetical protein
LSGAAPNAKGAMERPFKISLLFIDLI